VYDRSQSGESCVQRPALGLHRFERQRLFGFRGDRVQRDLASYTFSTCDKFAWSFGDGTSVQTLWPSISHQFAAGKARTVTLTVTNDFGSTTATSVVDAPLVGGTTCQANANTLCLENGRYQVTLDAINTLGDKKTTVATARPVTDIFGFMSFPDLTSNADNPEVFVKVLTFTDGKTWVFYGGLTNLEYFINIYDTKNAKTIQLHTPPPPASQPNRSIGSFNLGGVTPPACSDVTVTTRTVTGATCSTTDPNSFCLLNRFKVSMQARDGNPGGTASGPGVKVATGSSSNLYGFFSLPALTQNPANVEFFTKILDASTINQGYWLFFGGLTNFEYTVTVTDTTNGKTKDYFKPQGSTCGRNEAPAFPF
jgi:PKD domain.